MAGLVAAMLAGGLRGGGAAYENVSRTAYEDELRQQREKIANDRAVAIERMRQDRADSRDAINREDAWNRTSAGLIYRQADLDRQSTEAQKDRDHRADLTDKQIASSEKIAGMPAKRAPPTPQMVTQPDGSVYWVTPGKDPEPMMMGGKPFKGASDLSKREQMLAEALFKESTDPMTQPERATAARKEAVDILRGGLRGAGGGDPILGQDGKPIPDDQVQAFRAKQDNPRAVAAFVQTYGQAAADKAAGKSTGLVAGAASAKDSTTTETPAPGQAADGSNAASPRVGQKTGLVGSAQENRPAKNADGGVNVKGAPTDEERAAAAQGGGKKGTADAPVNAQDMDSLTRNDLEQTYVKAIQQIKGQIDALKEKQAQPLKEQERLQVAQQMQKMMDQIQTLKSEASKRGLKINSAGSVL